MRFRDEVGIRATTMAVYRTDLQKLARLRLREARMLLRADLFAGAYHVAGFSVECALKACIARNIGRYEFPDKKYQKVWVHKLEELVGLAGLLPALKAAKANRAFDANWAIAVKWDPEIRYTLSILKPDAIGLYSAITARKTGVLQWICNYW